MNTTLNFRSSGSAPKQKRTRKYVTRSRGACYTCKKRKVRCDETKPSCVRCLKFGFDCEGYRPPVSENRLSGLSERVSCGRTKTAEHPNRPIIAPCSMLISPSRFSSEYESRFFGFYLHEVASSIAGPLPYKDREDLWSIIIPQACEVEPYIRQLVISIGGLGEVSKSQLSETSTSRKSYQYSLTEYGKALRSLQEAIASGNCDIRHAFIACLLIFSFECWQGNSRSAIRHARSGLTLETQFGIDQNNAQPDSNLHVHEVTTSGKLYGIETDILQALASLETHICFAETWDNIPVATKDSTFDKLKFIYSCEESQLQPILNCMPLAFDSLTQIRMCWGIIECMGSRLHALIRNSRKHYGLRTPSLDENASWYSDKAKVHRDYSRRWFKASGTIFQQLLESGTQDEKKLVRLLQIQALHDHLRLQALFLGSPLEFDVFLLEFKTIVDSCEGLVPSSTASKLQSRFVNGGLFNFDVGIISPLSFVSFCCRDAVVRGRAIDLLRRIAYREGVWDGRATAFVADWLRRVEMEHVALGDLIPESNRAVMTLCEIDVDYKTVTLQCRRSGSGLLGKVELRTEKLDWKFGTRCVRVDCEPVRNRRLKEALESL